MIVFVKFLTAEKLIIRYSQARLYKAILNKTLGYKNEKAINLSGFSFNL